MLFNVLSVMNIWNSQGNHFFRINCFQFWKVLICQLITLSGNDTALPTVTTRKWAHRTKGRLTSYYKYFLIFNTALATDDLKPPFNISEASIHELKGKQIPYKWRPHSFPPPFNTPQNKHPLFPVYFTRKMLSNLIEKCTVAPNGMCDASIQEKEVQGNKAGVKFHNS